MTRAGGRAAPLYLERGTWNFGPCRKAAGRATSPRAPLPFNPEARGTPVRSRPGACSAELLRVYWAFPYQTRSGGFGETSPTEVRRCALRAIPPIAPPPPRAAAPRLFIWNLELGSWSLPRGGRASPRAPLVTSPARAAGQSRVEQSLCDGCDSGGRRRAGCASRDHQRRRTEPRSTQDFVPPRPRLADIGRAVIIAGVDSYVLAHGLLSFTECSTIRDAIRTFKSLPRFRTRVERNQ